jgi:large subunit ribosomal protein L25
MLSLTAKIRDPQIDLKNLRKLGELPSVFYGMGNKSTAISIPIVEFKKVWEKAGESSTVKITGPKISVDVLIHDVQVDPVTSEPIHADFLVIDMDKKIKVNIPLEFTGISEIVKNGVGTLVKVLHEVEIEALPKDLPHDFVIDISKLVALDSLILVSDISLPTGVTMISKASEVVASIVEQKEEKEEVVEPVDLTKIEVEKKGKKEEEGGEATEETITEKTEEKTK